MQIIEDIKPRQIYSAVATGPFDKTKRALERKGYRIVSLEQNAQLRIQEEAQSGVSKYGNWVREGVLYVPGKGKFLTKNSPIMAHPVKVTNAHRNRTDFYLTNRQVDSALEDSVELSLGEIPTNRFGEDEITSFAFGKSAKVYGDFLKECGIISMSIDTAGLRTKQFAGPLWFESVGNRSGFYGNDRDLHGDYKLRGVKISAEGTF